LGNIVQILPLLWALDRAIGPTDLALSKTSFGVKKELFPGRRVYLPGDEIPQAEYRGKVQTVWGNIHGNIAPDLPVLNDMGQQAMRVDCSEVSVYLKIAKGLGVTGIDYDCSRLIGFSPTDERFDVVISNGYNWKMGDLWTGKAYRCYPEVISELKSMGLSVCSVGAPQEYVTGTVNRTGIGLLKTLGLIKNSSVVLSNDSGFYHCAAALRKPAVVLFTFTNVVKNHDRNFHETATVLRTDLPCQAGCHAHHKWKECDHQGCRDVDPYRVVEEVVSKIPEVT
jgi:hypothetical protein